MKPDSSLHRRALLGLLLANLLWGLSFPVVKAMVHTQEQLLPGSGNWFITAMTVGPRFLLATVVLALVAGAKLRGLTRGELRQGAWLGLANALGLLLQVDGLQFTSASVSSFLTQFYAVLIPVVVALKVRRAPAPVVGACVLLVLAGVAILGRFDFHALSFGRGELSTLAGSVFFMGQIFVLADPRYAGNRALPVSAVMFATVGLLFTILALATAPAAADVLVPWTSGPWLVFTGLLTVFCTLGAFMLMIRWQPVITATEAGLIYCFEPLFASVMALFLPGLFSRWVGFDYPNETLTWQLLVGGGLITVANGLLQLKGSTGSEKEESGIKN
ncbi:EamA-like transporter family protein [Lacunisphaera limnophila]|uniref:EamA-like transporter family protein n=1 Tax=Lacunisphaera limnophila TaxID=1838286 RepID=A0A1D8AU80_9BACT|nr:EamA family transporter [Lacunisphaera limnophila]AOS44455.1 EamA-like transporter family protein [Lacunisphaera limnophila]